VVFRCRQSAALGDSAVSGSMPMARSPSSVSRSR
jgi:hypothetical protein